MVNISITKVEKIDDKEYAEYQRDLARWQECTCQPQDALLCPSCLRYTREKYGNEIPFFVDGREVTE